MPLNVSAAPIPRSAVLKSVDGLIDRALTLEDLERHGLQLLAGERWRRLGVPLPRRLLAQERLAAATSLAAPAVLERIRSAVDGDLLILKGPEVAVAYPDAALRPYGDLDLLVSDPSGAQRALMAAGFEPVGDPKRYVDAHHLPPLRAPRLPLLVEVHKTPHWPDWIDPPHTAELLEAGVPSRCGVAGILGLPPAHHSIVLAAHAWADAPLGSLRQLLDVALVAADAKGTDLHRLAKRWRASHLWGVTVGALECLFGGTSPPATLRLWARHLTPVRERTLLEAHVTSWISPLWYLSGLRGVKAGAAALATDLRPAQGECWDEKLRRTRLALADAFEGASEHNARVSNRRR